MARRRISQQCSRVGKTCPRLRPGIARAPFSFDDARQAILRSKVRAAGALATRPLRPSWKTDHIPNINKDRPLMDKVHTALYFISPRLNFWFALRSRL